MRFVWSSAIKDLRRHLADPVGLVLWISIPLIIGSIITLATGGTAGPKPTALLLIVDEDQTFVSGLVSAAFGQGQLAELVNVETVERQEGESRIAAGDGSGLLIIPAGFGDAVIEETPVELSLLTNPSQNILPKILKNTLEVMVDGIFYLHRILGDEIDQLTAFTDASGFPEDANIAALSVTINQKVNTLSDFLLPPVIELTMSSETPESTGQDINFGVLFLPGVLVMALLFTAQGTSEDLWKERMQGTMRRVVGTPAGALPLLIGKVLAAAILMALISVFGLVIGMGYHSLAFANLPLALFWSSISGIVLFLMMAAIQVYSSSQRTGAIVSGAIMFPLMMIGGSFFPSEAMPSWMGAVGAWTPNGMVVEQLKNILLDRIQPGPFVLDLTVFVIFAVVFLGVISRRLRKHFAVQ